MTATLEPDQRQSREALDWAAAKLGPDSLTRLGAERRPELARLLAEGHAPRDAALLALQALVPSDPLVTNEIYGLILEFAVQMAISELSSAWPLRVELDHDDVAVSTTRTHFSGLTKLEFQSYDHLCAQIRLRVRNRIKDASRRVNTKKRGGGRRSSTPIEDLDDVLVAPSQESPLSHASYRELLATAGAFLATLPDRELEILTRRAKGATYADIGETLGLTADNARVIHGRVEQRLRRAHPELFDDD